MAVVAASILGKISGYLLAPIGRQFCYLLSFNSNIESLENELEKLKNVKVGVQHDVDAARRNLGTLTKTVEAWLNRVNEIEEAARKIIEDKDEFPKGCFGRWCLNLKSRYVLSCDAKNRTRCIVELQQEMKLEKISCPVPLGRVIVSTSTRTFESRESVLSEILRTLRGDEINMIGICGMGGVGKTTMVEEILERVTKEEIFDDFAMTIINQKPDFAKVQSDIAEMLGLELQEQNPRVREVRLHQRLENKRSLIILDDVWAEFDLKVLGITFQGRQKGCKVIFTSREHGLWREQKTKIDIPLDVLSDEEAWQLFEEKVLDSLQEQTELQPVAEEIVEECGGLPLALVTIGGALLGKSKHVWNDTLRQLRMVYPTKIQGVSAKVYQSLELSYNYLEDEEAKSLFLLCCLFKEDFDIPVESLVRIVFGLRLFQGIHDLEGVRDRVWALLEKLKSCSLLLPSNKRLLIIDDECIKMHDVVRDVAKSIASVEKGALVLDYGAELTVWQEQSKLKDYTWISTNGISALATESRFPRVKLLQCSDTNLEITDSFFQGMGELRVLYFHESFILQLPSSLRFLSSLQTLSLQKCILKNTGAIGDLPNLSILSLAKSRFEELPREIGRLTNLMLLDLSHCWPLKKIPPGVFSSLIHLQELYMGGLWIDWEGEEYKGGNASLREFAELSNLHTLHIKIKDANVLPRSSLFSNLKKFDIIIGNAAYGSISPDGEKISAISLHTFVPLGHDINFLAKNSEKLLLEGEFLKDLVHELVRERSKGLKHLSITEIGTLEDLTNTMDCTAAAPLILPTVESLYLSNLDNLRQMSCSPIGAGSFGKLKELRVFDCLQLRNIFQLSIATQIVRLKVLYIRRCDGMEEIICKQRQDATNKIEFSKLEMLKIEHLPSLISFCRGIDEIEFPQLTVLKLENLPKLKCLISRLRNQSSNSEENPFQSIFPQKVSIPNLEEMSILNLVNMKEIWCGRLHTGSFRNLARLTVSECDSLRNLFSCWMVRYLVHLHTLNIDDCLELEKVVAQEEDSQENTCILPKLKDVRLAFLPALKSFCHYEHELEFPELEQLRVVGCPELKTFSAGFVRAPKLNTVTLSHEYYKKQETLWKGNLNDTILHLHDQERLRKEMAKMVAQPSKTSVWRLDLETWEEQY